VSLATALTGIAEDSEDSCGPMGVGDLFMDSASDDLVAFLQLSLRTRASLVDYLSDGALLRPPQLSPAPLVGVYTSSFDGSQAAYDTVLVQAWRLPAVVGTPGAHRRGGVMVLLVNSAQQPYSGEVEICPANWDLTEADLAVGAMKVRDLHVGAHAAHVGSHADKDNARVSGGVLRVPVHLAGRSVKVLEWRL
jgi:hypothetical protein